MDANYLIDMLIVPEHDVQDSGINAHDTIDLSPVAGLLLDSIAELRDKESEGDITTEFYLSQWSTVVRILASIAIRYKWSRAERGLVRTHMWRFFIKPIERETERQVTLT